MGKGQYAHLSYDVSTINKGESLFLRTAGEVENRSMLNTKATPEAAKRMRRASISEGVPMLSSASADAFPTGWRAGRRASMPTMRTSHASLMPLVPTAAPASEPPLFATPSQSSSAATMCAAVAHRPSRVPSQPSSRDTSQPPSRGEPRRPSADGAMFPVALGVGAAARPYSPVETDCSSMPPKPKALRPSRPASAQASAQRSKGGVVLNSTAPPSTRPTRPASASASAMASTVSLVRSRKREERPVELITPASRLEAILQQHAGLPDELGRAPPLTRQHTLKVTVEHCIAPRPSQTLRGSQEKYAHTFRSLRAAVEPLVGAATLDMAANADGLSPRIGAFEVSFTLVDGASNTSHGPFPLFSKLERGAWPSPRRLASQLEVAVHALLKHARH